MPKVPNRVRPTRRCLADLAMDDYVALLRPLGAMVNVGIPTSSYSVQPGSLVGGSRVLAGSNIGGIA